MTIQGWITIVTIAGILTALIRNKSRPDFIFLTGLAFLMVTQVLTPLQAFSGFSNQAVFTVAFLFIVAAGIHKTRALSFLERFIFKDGLSLRGVLLRLMAGTSAFSSVLNNTPIVAMMIPQVKEWAQRTGNSPSKLLIPLSYAAITGGVVTLVGTSTNLIVSGMLEDRGFSPLGFFDLTAIGLSGSILVFVYFYLWGYKQLPNHNIKTDTTGAVSRKYQFDLKIPANSSLSSQTIEEAGMRGLENLFLIHIHRQGKVIGPVGPHVLLEEFDVLTFIGDINSVDSFAERKGLKPATPKLDTELDTLPLFEAVLAPTSSLVGKTLKEARFREKYHAVVLGIQRKDDTIRGALGNVKLQVGDLLMIEAKADFDEFWNDYKDEFYIVTRQGFRERPLTNKSSIALIILAGMLALFVFEVIPVVTAAFAAAILMVVTRCVKPSEILDVIHIPILLVIAAAIGVGQAIETSGLADYFGNAIIGATASYGIIATIIAVYLLTNILTELITNNAAAVLVLPIALVASVQTGIPPEIIAITVAVAASASFLSPIGYQTNLMVMSAGSYSFADYTKAGLPVTLILLVTTTVVLYLRML